jgi:hypothetical protein
MTLRQEYAGPRPHAIARHRDQPAGPPLPLKPSPPGSSRVSRAPAQLPQQPRVGRAHRPLRARTLPVAAGPPPAGPSPRGHAQPPTPAFPAARAHRREPPPKPAPGTAGAPSPVPHHRRPAPRPASPEPSNGLLPQAAGTEAGSCGRSVGVLQAAPCGELSPSLVTVGPAATATQPDQRHPTRHNPATSPRRPRCTQPSTHKIAQTPPADPKRARSHDGPRPRLSGPDPPAAPGKDGLLDRPRTAALPVVPAPADRRRDELRDPPARRAAVALAITLSPLEEDEGAQL